MCLTYILINIKNENFHELFAKNNLFNFFYLANCTFPPSPNVKANSLFSFDLILKMLEILFIYLFLMCILVNFIDIYC